MVTVFEAVATTMRDLKQLLGSDYLKEGANTPIGRAAARVFDLYNQRNFDESQRLLVTLRGLVEDLQNIKSYDEKLLKTYRRKFNNSLDFDNYFGVRFEIAIASDLIRMKCKFNRVSETNKETPDFVIHGSPDCYVECGSAHITKARPKDLEYKISSAIDDKSKKRYCNRNTALFIDITNINHHALNFQMPVLDRLPKLLEKKIEASGYGSLLLYLFMFDEQGHYFLRSRRNDSEKISAELKNSLDAYRPIVEYKLDRYYQPWSG